MSEMYAAMFIKNGYVVDSGDGTDATIVTATILVPAFQRAVITGLVAMYDDPVTVLKTITVKSASATLFVVRYDFTPGLLIFSFPNPLHSAADAEDVTVDLEAGPAGIAGRVLAFYALD